MSDQDSGYNSGDYNKSGFFIFVFSFGFSILFFIYLGYFHEGVDLKEIKEQSAALKTEMAADKAKVVDVSNVESPWISSEDMIAHGKVVFSAQCAVCHGVGGLGDGPAGKSLNPPARNLVEGGWKKGGTSKELFLTLKNGIAGGSMASFAHLSKVDRWALVHHIRSITKDKPEDDLVALEAFAKEQ